jgi:hypothetical protein
VIFGRYPIFLNSSLHPDRTLGSYGTECLDYLTPLPHHRGTPARRAIRPGMPIPRLDPEAGLAWGCGEEEERVRNCQKLPVIVKYPGKPLAPTQGPRPPGPPAGGRAREPVGLPFIALSPHNTVRVMAVSPAPLPGGGVLHRCRSSPHTLPGAGHPPPPLLRPGSFWVAGGSRRAPTPGPQHPLT